MRNVDFTHDSSTQSEFAGTVFLECDINPEQIANEWTIRHTVEKNLDLSNVIINDCYDGAEDEAMIAAEILQADALAINELDIERQAEEGEECRQQQISEQVGDDAYMDSEDSSVGEDYMLDFMSPEEVIEEIQHRLDSVSDGILYARKNITFGVATDVHRLLTRLEHLSVASTDTLTMLHELEFKHRQLKKRQSKMTSFFIPPHTKQKND